MVRLHPAVRYKSILFDGRPKCINTKEYEDVQELLSTVDVVITDYSGLMFDFAIRRLPVFLYTPDMANYTRERNFYFDLNDLPFTVAENQDILLQHIKTFDLNRYIEQVNLFLDRVGSRDNGTASTMVVDRIVNRNDM